MSECVCVCVCVCHCRAIAVHLISPHAVCVCVCVCVCVLSWAWEGGRQQRWLSPKPVQQQRIDLPGGTPAVVLDGGTDEGLGWAGRCQAACTWLYPTGLCTSGAGSGAEHGLVLTRISVRLVLQKGA